MTSGIESLRDNVYIQGLIERMFDYDQEITQVESEIFNRPDQMDVVFNYIDLSFQLLPASSDEAYTKHAKYLHILLKYYDVKSSLNMSHSSKIIDVFRYWIWKDPYLAKYLDQQTDGIDKSQNIETAQFNTAFAPQPSSMEVDTQSNLDKLVSKNPAVSEVEQTLDNIKGTAKVFWHSLWIGKQLVLPIVSMSWEMSYAETQKSNSMPANYFYMVYVKRLQKPKNNGWKEP